MIKYKLTQKGIEEAIKRSLNRKMYYTIEDKIFQVLRSGVGHTANSLHSTFIDDRTIAENVTIGAVKTTIGNLIKNGYIIDIDEVPIQPDKAIKGGSNKWPLQK